MADYRGGLTSISASLRFISPARSRVVHDGSSFFTLCGVWGGGDRPSSWEAIARSIAGVAGGGRGRVRHPRIGMDRSGRPIGPDGKNRVVAADGLGGIAGGSAGYWSSGTQGIGVWRVDVWSPLVDWLGHRICLGDGLVWGGVVGSTVLPSHVGVLSASGVNGSDRGRSGGCCGGRNCNRDGPDASGLRSPASRCHGNRWTLTVGQIAGAIARASDRLLGSASSAGGG